MKHLLSVRNLIAFTTKGITPKYVQKSSIIVLNQKCIRNNKIDYSFAQYHDDSASVNKEKLLRVGDILINSTGQGTAGRCAFVKELPPKYKVIVDSHILIVRVNDFYTAGCLAYSLYSIETELQTFMDGSTGQGEFDKQRLFNIMTGLPKQEYRKIAYAILNGIDQKIELNNRINAELEAMAKTLYDYWFVQFDFPDEKGRPYKSSGGKMVYNGILKRKIPEGWEDAELSDIANITMGQSPEGFSYNEEGKGTTFFQGSTDFGWRFPKVRQFTTAPNRMAGTGDILLSVRAPVGTINIASTDCCIGRGLAALNSKTNSDGFLFYVMQYFKQIFDRRNFEGTTFGSITKDDLFSLKLVKPSSQIQKAFDEIVSKDNAMIFERSKENIALIALRDWLLPMLMNGQVKVV